MQRRLERFDAKLAQSGLDALLVTGQNNIDRKSTRLNSSHSAKSRMPSSA